MITIMTLDDFQAACKEQAPRQEEIVFVCPMCKRPQNALDLIEAGAGKDFDEVNKYLGFSCVGRWTGAGSPRKKPDGKPCNWTLGGLFRVHEFAVITTDGKSHPLFRLVTKEEADAYRAIREKLLTHPNK